jgi:hypothetical protein
VSGEVPVAKQPHDHVADVALLVSLGGSGGRAIAATRAINRAGEKKSATAVAFTTIAAVATILLPL